MHDRLVALTLDALTYQLARSEREAAFIDRQVTRLDRIVSDVLDFARPLRVEPAPVDVAALLWDAAGTAVGADAEPHVHLALESGVGTIVTDAERLRGVLVNLVQNARDAIFEPFFTTKRAGTGLGLAIAHKVVEALGGSIRMKSREGEGTRVEIELPTALRVGPRE